MERVKWELQSLSDALLKTIREHGIKEVSIEQYKTVLKKIVCFANEHGFNSYYPKLKDDFDAFIDSNVEKKIVCFEYARFQHRVIRMLASLAETGETDLSQSSDVTSQQSLHLISRTADVVLRNDTASGRRRQAKLLSKPVHNLQIGLCNADLRHLLPIAGWSLDDGAVLSDELG